MEMDLHGNLHKRWMTIICWRLRITCVDFAHVFICRQICATNGFALCNAAHINESIDNVLYSNQCQIYGIYGATPSWLRYKTASNSRFSAILLIQLKCMWFGARKTNRAARIIALIGGMNWEKERSILWAIAAAKQTQWIMPFAKC